MRWLAAAFWAISAPAMAQGFDEAVRDLLGDDPARYRAAIEGFQAAVRAGDGRAASAFVNYPIEVEIDGRPRIVRGAEDFAAQYAAIVTPEIAERIASEKVDEMPVSYQGVMLGRGEAWVSGVCLNAVCAGPAVRVVAIQTPLEEPAPAVGRVEAFHDWRVGCDNGLGCTAIGLPPEDDDGDAVVGDRGYVVLRREGGPGDAPTLGFVLLAPDVAGAPATTMRVAVIGKDGLGPIELPVTEDGAWLRALAPEDGRDALVTALRDGDRVELALGDGAPAIVSLRGATAAMLAIDDRQGRIGTVTALARPGDMPAAGVPAAPAPPEVIARPIAALDGPPPAGVVAGDDPSCDGVAAVGFDLGDGRTLWGACVIAGAYNTTFRFWTDGPEGLTAASFPVPGRAGRDAATLTGPALAADGRSIEATDLGRGLGDCGETSRWAWTGEGFALVALAGLDDCAGVSPDDWPMLWRAG